MRMGTHRDDPTLFSGKLLRINPTDELSFAIDGCREPSASITLTNNSAHCVAFKVKTTSPEKYRVRPSSGIIRPHCQCEVVVQLQTTYHASSITRDKFLVMAIALDHPDICNQELCEIWRLTPKDKIMEYKLRCVVAASCPNIYSCPPPPDYTRCGMGDGNKDQSRNAQQQSQKLYCLIETIDTLRCEICCLRRLVFIVLFLLLFLIIMLFIMIRFGIEPFVVKQVIVNSCVGPNIA